MSVVIHFLWSKGLTVVEISREVDEVYGRLCSLSEQLKGGWPVLLRVRRASKIFPGVVGRIQTKILLSLPNYSPTILTLYRKELPRFSASARQ
jgi:hypothetical protein